MPNQNVTITERDIREFARIIRGMDREQQNMKENRQSEGTPRLVRGVSDAAVASDAVAAVTEISNPTMIWDDPDRGWGYSEWTK